MDVVVQVIQIVVALGIFNVWFLRFNKSTDWRGGSAANMKEEFATYGLPSGAVYVIGALKILCAAGLIAGIWVPTLVRPSAIGLAILMLGAITMHLKVGDPAKKSLPALLMLILSVIIALS
jgi:hypothetical protein